MLQLDSSHHPRIGNTKCLTRCWNHWLTKTKMISMILEMFTMQISMRTLLENTYKLMDMKQLKRNLEWIVTLMNLNHLMSLIQTTLKAMTMVPKCQDLKLTQIRIKLRQLKSKLWLPINQMKAQQLALFTQVIRIQLKIVCLQMIKIKLMTRRTIKLPIKQKWQLSRVWLRNKNRLSNKLNSKLNKLLFLINLQQRLQTYLHLRNLKQNLKKLLLMKANNSQLTLLYRLKTSWKLKFHWL